MVDGMLVDPNRVPWFPSQAKPSELALTLAISENQVKHPGWISLITSVTLGRSLLLLSSMAGQCRVYNIIAAPKLLILQLLSSMAGHCMAYNIIAAPKLRISIVASCWDHTVHVHLPCAGTKKQKNKVLGHKELWCSQILGGGDVEADETAGKVNSEEKQGDPPPLFCHLWL